jgi:hypothetical protein
MRASGLMFRITKNNRCGEKISAASAMGNVQSKFNLGYRQNGSA